MAINVIEAMAGRAELFVSYNTDFDLAVLATAFDRCDLDNPLAGMPEFCAMKACVPVCKLPGRRGDYKYPKLIEAYQHFFGTGFDGAHGALADVRACSRIFFELKKRQLVPLEVLSNQATA